VTLAQWVRPHSLYFEPHTFSTTTEISIEVVRNESAFGPRTGSDILKLGPSSVSFGRLATLSFYYKASDDDTVYVERYNESSRSWDTRQYSDNDAARTLVVAKLSSFSYWRLRLGDSRDRVGVAPVAALRDGRDRVGVAPVGALREPTGNTPPREAPAPPDRTTSASGLGALMAVVGGVVLCGMSVLACACRNTHSRQELAASSATHAASCRLPPPCYLPPYMHMPLEEPQYSPGRWHEHGPHFTVTPVSSPEICRWGFRVDRRGYAS